jgi:hypothetical protein
MPTKAKSKTKSPASSPNSAANDVLPPIPAGFNMPFYYHSLTDCELFFRADPKIFAPYLEGTGLAVALFDGLGAASFNFQNYTAQFANFDSVVLEIECNILAYPVSRQRDVPQLTLAEFLSGQDQTKLIGNHHFAVACTNANAVEAGIKLFGEPKFLANINPNTPSPNSPGVDTWGWVCSDYDASNPGNQTPLIFSTTLDVRGLTPVLNSASPITEYGRAEGKLIAARWNIFGDYTAYLAPPGHALPVKMTYGTSKQTMRADLQAIIGATPCAAVRIFQSAPVATQARSFYVSP